MNLLQSAPQPDEVASDTAADLSPAEVAEVSEKDWYSRVFRRDSAQLTVRAVAMGSVLGFFLALTNVYISLKVGFSIGVAITACMASFTIWTTLVKTGLARSPMTILESNCMQSTASSAGYATGPVVASALPALLMLSVSDANPRGTNQPWWYVAPWIFSVAALGVVMAIPMKRGMINGERLRFPSGTAAAVLLHSLHKAGKEGLAKGRALLWACLAGAMAPLLKDLNLHHGEGLVPDHSNAFDWLPLRHVRWVDPKSHEWVAKWTAASEWGMSLDHGVLLLGAGALVGVRTTSAMVLGGLVMVLVLGPSGLGWGWTNAHGDFVSAARLPETVYTDVGTWFGAPLLVAYGLVAFSFRFGVIGRAIASVATERRDAPAGVEVPLRWFLTGTCLAGACIAAVAALAFSIPVHYTVLAIVLAFLIALVVCRATGETDITPGGPMGKLVQLTYGVLMPQNYAANVMTASITDGASLACADLLNDLKAGYLLGAHPKRQFVAQFLGIFSGTVATCIAYYALIPDAPASRRSERSRLATGCSPARCARDARCARERTTETLLEARACATNAGPSRRAGAPEARGAPLDGRPRDKADRLAHGEGPRRGAHRDTERQSGVPRGSLFLRSSREAQR